MGASLLTCARAVCLRKLRVFEQAHEKWMNTSIESPEYLGVDLAKQLAQSDWRQANDDCDALERLARGY